MALLLPRGYRTNPSLLSLNEYRTQAGSTQAWSLEYEALVSRVVPPNVEISNTSDDSATVVCIDSANRPGTLIEVVQHFTELGLAVKSARVSSDGGWFVDEFRVTEANGQKVTNARKLRCIQSCLNITVVDDDQAILKDEVDESTVVELAGQDKAGLLGDVTQLLTHNGCNVRSAAVWTYNSRVAFVVSVTEQGKPIAEGPKLQRLRQIMLGIMDPDGGGGGIARARKVRGEVHHDRRLHQLMLEEEVKAWDRRACDDGGNGDDSDGAPSFSGRGLSIGEAQPGEGGGEAGGGLAGAAVSSPTDSASSLHGALMASVTEAADDPLALYRSPKHSKPEVEITPCGRYWLVSITCKDRSKLLFDTVCTLADLNYDVFHATIDSRQGVATQEYYIKPRTGNPEYNEARVEKLAAMLEASIQRRFPKGLKVHVHSVDRSGCLAALTRVLKAANLSITRAKVKTHAVNNSSGHTFYVMGANGQAPNRGGVEAACRQIGGVLVDAGETGGAPPTGSAKFSFSFLHRQWNSEWAGVASSTGSNCSTGSA